MVVCFWCLLIIQFETQAGYDDVRNDLVQVFEKSYLFKKQNHQEAVSSAVFESIYAERRFSLLDSANYGLNQGREPFSEAENTVQLKYRRDAGYATSVYSKQFNSTDYTLSNRAAVLELGLRGEYEFLRQGSKNPAMNIKRIDAFDEFGRLVQGEIDRNDELTFFQESISNLIEAACNRLDAHDILKRYQEVIKAAKIKHESRVIGTRDYLRIQSIESSLRLNLAFRENVYSRIVQFFARFGGDVSSKVKSLSITSQECVMPGGVSNNTGAPRRESLLGKIGSSPGALLYEIGFKQADARVTQSNLFETPSLIFKGAGAGIKTNDGRTVGAWSVGLDFEYIFPDEASVAILKREKANRALIEFNRNQFNIKQTQVLVDLYAYIDDLFSEMRLIGENIDILERALKIIETQQAVGMLDVNAATSTYLDFVEARAKQRAVTAKANYLAGRLDQMDKYFRRGNLLRDWFKERTR